MNIEIRESKPAIHIATISREFLSASHPGDPNLAAQSIQGVAAMPASGSNMTHYQGVKARIAEDRAKLDREIVDAKKLFDVERERVEEQKEFSYDKIREEYDDVVDFATKKADRKFAEIDVVTEGTGSTRGSLRGRTRLTRRRSG